ncbi:hypothetical protein HanIR_Chr07g0315241 [Helianthus annuus]|nr:hypothetical protein HanIR_Chr07g0315241 [Helianthus annuus]
MTKIPFWLSYSDWLRVVFAVLTTGGGFPFSAPLYIYICIYIGEGSNENQ